MRSVIRSAKAVARASVERLRFQLRDRRLDPPRRHLELLRTLETNRTPHLHGRHLLAHLSGTYRLLKRWDEPEHVCLAGLFHSIYGTYNFRTAVVEIGSRELICDQIGGRSERLVYLFCSEDRQHAISNLDRKTGFSLMDWRQQSLEHLSREDVSEIFTLRLADQLEVLPYNRGSGHGNALRRYRPFLANKAKAALDTALASAVET